MRVALPVAISSGGGVTGMELSRVRVLATGRRSCLTGARDQRSPESTVKDASVFCRISSSGTPGASSINRIPE